MASKEVIWWWSMTTDRKEPQGRYNQCVVKSCEFINTIVGVVSRVDGFEEKRHTVCHFIDEVATYNEV